MRKDIFRNKFLLALAGGEWSDIDWNQAYLTKKNFFQAAHLLDTGSIDTVQWAQGKKDLSVDNFIKEFGSLKPCIHGSDAHSLDKICKPDGNKYCWIKADTTFEGLKQILFEPSERVHIGDQPPRLKNDYQIINTIEIVGADSWFKSESIPLNKNLVAIIGGRGSGKSALAELIAFAGGSAAFRNSDDIDESFLSKASRKSETNPFPIPGIKLSLNWADGHKEQRVIPSNLCHGLEQDKEEVKYLPQKFVERLCAPEHTSQLEEEIERVIFQRIKKIERPTASSFRELRESSTKSISTKRNKLKQTIESLNKNINDDRAKLELRPTKKKELGQKNDNLKSLLAKVPEVPTENKDELEKLDKLTEKQKDIEDRIGTLNDTLAVLDSIDTKLELFGEEIGEYNTEIDALLILVDLDAEKDKFHVAKPPFAKDLVENKRVDITKQINALKGIEPTKEDWIERIVEGVGGPAESDVAEIKENVEAVIGNSDLPNSLYAIEEAINKIREKSKLSGAKRQEYDKFQKDRQAVESAITSLSKELKELDEIVEPRLKANIDDRLEKYLDYFQLLKEEKAVLENLYKPLHNALLGSNEMAKKLAFVSKITFDVTSHGHRGLEILDQRKMRYRDGGIEDSLKIFFEKIEESGFEREKVRGSINEFVNWVKPFFS